MHHSRHHYVDIDHPIDDKIFEFNNLNTNFNFIHPKSPSISPLRDLKYLKNKREHIERYESPIRDFIYTKPAFTRPGLIDRYERFEPSPTRERDGFVAHFPHPRPNVPFVDRIEFVPDQEEILKLKWLDNSPRMSRLREYRSKRLASRLEQFELWDLEQEQKQKQYELAREQRYNSIIDRLKSQDFCLTQMRRRHESDLETARDLEPYEKEHIFIDALDNNQEKQRGPITEFRRFEAEMDNKLKVLEAEIDEINPKYRIQQAIIPRIERTREIYSVEPEIYTVTGKRVLRRPSLTPMRGESGTRYSEDRESSIRSHDYDDLKAVKFYYPVALNDRELFTERIKHELNTPSNTPINITEQQQQQKQQQKPKPKPIIRHSEENEIDYGVSKLKLSTSSDRRVNFKDDIKDNSSNQETKKPASNNTVEAVVETKNEDQNSVDAELAAEVVVKTENKSENTNQNNTNDTKVVVNGDVENKE